MKILLFLMSVAIIGCDDDHSKYVGKILDEFVVQPIQLPAPLNADKAEISGLTMKNDTLFILPQYPERFGEQAGTIFFTTENEIENAIRNQSELKVEGIQIKDPKNLLSLDGFQGFEAIVFDGRLVYFTIECEVPGQVSGYLLTGALNKDRIELLTIKEIPLPAQISNLAFETMTIFHNKVYLIYEANGVGILHKPVATIFDPADQSFTKIPIPNIEYRITDASGVDGNGHFTVMNYFYPGDKELACRGVDPLVRKYGLGKSQQSTKVRERILQMKIDEKRISLVEQAPEYLQLSSEAKGRNWEGLAKTSDGSIIIATDKFPHTILAKLQGSEKHAEKE